MDGKTPRLMEVMFGGQAERAWRGASRRMRRWCEAFDGWVGERGASASKQRRLTWRGLLEEQGKMPWELRQEDIEAHVRWMKEKGYAVTTISNRLGMISNFYRWCDDRGVDRACGAEFDPAREVRRPKIRRYAEVTLLSQAEVEALLSTLKRDRSPLGKRDTAFVLTRLRTGAPLRAVQQLRWGQIEEADGKRWVRWGGKSGRVELARDAWEAIRKYLAASGRLKGMGMEEYIFAPVKEPVNSEDATRRRENWKGGRYLSSSQLLSILKLYGRLAGIDEKKLTLTALRHTATRLQMEAGAGMREMQSFLDSQEEARHTKHRLRKLPPMPEGERQAATKGEIPERQARPFQPGEGRRHGLYAQSQPSEAVRAVLREDIQGVEEEIVGMRRLARGLLELLGEAAVRRNKANAARLAEAYTLTAARLGAMIEAEKQLLTEDKGDEWANEMLAIWDRIDIEEGRSPCSVAIRAEAAMAGGDVELDLAWRRVVEEIAATRFILRSTLRLAEEAKENGEVQETMHLTEIYSNGCSRLMRLLRAEGANKGQLAELVQEIHNDAIRSVLKEKGWEVEEE